MTRPPPDKTARAVAVRPDHNGHGIPHKNQGIVIGKRVRISEAVSQAARSRDQKFREHVPVINESEWVWGADWPGLRSLNALALPRTAVSRNSCAFRQ